ncbi:MAG: S-methyl-5-thioribose-1-phosphate isomerase, partial [Chloroflexota bacterium]|nr:S-methyl-5-thioribose-1-phosphate isomerase [Chloroflexota bacterium]
VPVYCVVPTSTIDLKLTGGDQIPIEERPQEEVLELKFYDRKTTPPRATARNPAFDITPHRLITAFITENGVVYPPFERNLANTVKDLRE